MIPKLIISSKSQKIYYVRYSISKKNGTVEDGGRVVRAEPSSPCAQLEHLANLLSNRVNSQWNPSLYEVWRPNIVEDIEKPTMKRLSQVRSLVSAQGPRSLWPPSQAPAAGYGEES